MYDHAAHLGLHLPCCLPDVPLSDFVAMRHCRATSKRSAGRIRTVHIGRRRKVARLYPRTSAVQNRASSEAATGIGRTLRTMSAIVSPREGQSAACGTTSRTVAPGGRVARSTPRPTITAAEVRTAPGRHNHQHGEGSLYTLNLWLL